MRSTDEDQEESPPLTEAPSNFHFSLKTMLLWTVAISVAISTPEWLGTNSIMAVFYGTVVLVAWQLSHWLPIFLSSLLAVLAAIGAAFLMATLVS